MSEADDVLVEALLDDVLDPNLLRDAADEALRLLQGDAPAFRLAHLDAEIATVTRERDRLLAAVATGGELGGLLEALRTRDARQQRLEAERDALRSQRGLKASEAARVRDELLDLAKEWRHVLANDAGHARPIVSALLQGRVTFTPDSDRPKRWILRGEGTLAGLFTKAVFPVGVASPAGPPVGWRPPIHGFSDLKAA